jgi:hypothetical protein
MSTLITSDKTAFIKSFIQNAGSSIVSVEFQKLDGTIRSLQFNPRDTREVKGTGYALKAPSLCAAVTSPLLARKVKAPGVPLTASGW